MWPHRSFQGLPPPRPPLGECTRPNSLSRRCTTNCSRIHHGSRERATGSLTGASDCFRREPGGGRVCRRGDHGAGIDGPLTHSENKKSAARSPQSFPAFPCRAPDVSFVPARHRSLISTLGKRPTGRSSHRVPFVVGRTHLNLDRCGSPVKKNPPQTTLTDRSRCYIRNIRSPLAALPSDHDDLGRSLLYSSCTWSPLRSGLNRREIARTLDARTTT